MRARWPRPLCCAPLWCTVSGIDITPSFVEAANKLTAMLGMEDQVTIVHGDGQHLPYRDASFDGAYSQHVTMNVADRHRFFGEAYRVLKPGAFFALTEHGMGPVGNPHYPLPWSMDGTGSVFDVTIGHTRAFGSCGLRGHSDRGHRSNISWLIDVRWNSRPKEACLLWASIFSWAKVHLRRRGTRPATSRSNVRVQCKSSVASQHKPEPRSRPLRPWSRFLNVEMPGPKHRPWPRPILSGPGPVQWESCNG